MPRKPKFNAFREGRVHVRARMCSTCIYRPDSPVYKSPIIDDAIKRDNAVICHATLDTAQQAVCAGFAANEMTLPIIGMRLYPHLVTKVEPPSK